jgi:hypothetical protein
MNTEQHQKPDPYAELIAAHEAGKTIQLLFEGSWTDLHWPSFSFSPDRYRIKPDNSMNKPPRIVITLTGGVVQGVLCDSPVEILLLDYDVEGADPSTVVSVPQCTKPTEESDHELAFLARVNPEANPDRVQQLFNLKSHE